MQYPPGIVISQVELTGTKLKKGSRVSVVVSTGMDAGDLKIPDLVGKNVEEAKKIILQNKFTIGKINFQPSTTVPVNAVIDQYPKSNTMAKENQRIDLFVNKVVKKEIPDENEMNSMEEIDKDNEDIEKDSDKPKSLDKEKKDKKEDIKKEEKPKPTDKKDDKKTEKKDEKKKTDKPKDTEKKDDGTKF